MQAPAKAAVERPRTTARPRARARGPARRASGPRRGEEDRCPAAFGVLRAEPFDVVLARYSHATWPEIRIRKRRVHEVTALDGDHPSRAAVADEVHGDVR